MDGEWVATILSDFASLSDIWEDIIIVYVKLDNVELRLLKLYLDEDFNFKNLYPSELLKFILFL